jgi:Flp pilus assembly protein TadB
MTRIEMALLAFTSFNAVRVLAYFPQMAAIIRDTNGATAVSYWTWSLFAASHLSAVAYALVAIGDWQVVTVFAINAVCCIVIILLTFYKRREHRSHQQTDGDAVDPKRTQPEALNRFPIAWRTS